MKVIDLETGTIHQVIRFDDRRVVLKSEEFGITSQEFNLVNYYDPDMADRVTDLEELVEELQNQIKEMRK